jgi:uroporphyrinogen-III synthase
MSSGALKVAVFRDSQDAGATQGQLAVRGFEAALAPVTEIVAFAVPAPAGPFDFAVATSARAFAFGSGGALAGLPLFVVGEKTAQAAQRQGLAPAPAADDVESLLPRLPAGRALYWAGRDRKPDLERALAGRVEVVETYAAQARAGWRPEEAEAVAGAVAALHYSARGAALAAAFAEVAGMGPAFLRLTHVCISREAAAPLAAAGAPRALWPQRPTESALLDVLESALACRL